MAKEKPYFSPTDDSFDISAFRDRSFKLYFRTKKAARAPLALLTVSVAVHHLRYLQPGQGWDGASGHEQRPLGGRWVAVGEGPWWGDRPLTGRAVPPALCSTGLGSGCTNLRLEGGHGSNKTPQLRGEIRLGFAENHSVFAENCSVVMLSNANSKWAH